MSAPPSNGVGFPPVPARPSAHLPVRADADATSDRPPASRVIRFDWRKNAVLFVLTVVSVFFVGQMNVPAELDGVDRWLSAWTFAVPLLFILLCHEFGHYIAARLHRVPASLPYFLPLPVLNPFGTLGAIILMPDRIRSRKALLDIGAAGPLAGMVVAVPIMLWGLALSKLGPRAPTDVAARLASDPVVQEGQSLLYAALKYVVFGPIPDHLDVYLHPTAFAAWAGFFVTFLNLLPFGQLDGGHVAYALLGERQNRVARWVLWAPLLLLTYNFAVYVAPILAYGARHGFATLDARAYLPVGSMTMWLTLFVLLVVLRRVAGSDHPPVDDPTLSRRRKIVGVMTLALFALLFMPSPLVVL